MVGLGAGLRPGRRRVGGSSGLGNDLDFSALSALPVGRQSAVTTAANAAATTLGVSAQSIIDALAVGRGLASLLPNDGCNLASSGGAVTSQGDPVGAIQTWTGVELATQANTSLRPVSGVSGIVSDGTDRMSLGDLSAWTAGYGLAVVAVEADKPFSQLWRIGNCGLVYDNIIRTTTNGLYVSFGSDTRTSALSVAVSSKGIYDVDRASGTTSIYWNTGLVGTLGGTTTFRSDATFVDEYYGTVSALVLNSTLYTTAQRAAVREFCKEYFGVVY